MFWKQVALDCFSERLSKPSLSCKIISKLMCELNKMKYEILSFILSFRLLSYYKLLQRSVLMCLIRSLMKSATKTANIKINVIVLMEKLEDTSFFAELVLNDLQAFSITLIIDIRSLHSSFN